MGFTSKATRVLATALLFTTTSCATITETKRVERIHLRHDQEEKVVPGSERLGLTADVDGSDLVVDVEETRTCSVVDYDVERKIEVTERSLPAKWTEGALFSYILYGGLGILVGASAILNAEGLAEEAAARGEPTEPETYVGMGVGFLGVGVAIAGGGIGGDLLRAKDSRRDLGVERTNVERKERVCRPAPAVGTTVSLVLSSGRTSSATTGADGTARFSMTDMSLDELGGLKRETHIRLAGGDRLLNLSAAQRLRAYGTLLADRRSRAHAEADELRRKECRYSLRRVSELGTGASPAYWEATKRTCGELWTDRNQAQLEDAARRREEQL